MGKRAGETRFRAEVEAEQALARGEHLLAMIDANPHADLAGPAADEAANRLDQLGAKARYQGISISDPRRLRRLMSGADPAIYPGTYVTCVYDHAKALCQRRTASSPDLAACQPLNCRNVALTSDNAAAWDRELARLDQRLTARPPLPPLLARQLQTRREQIQRLLDEAGQGR